MPFTPFHLGPALCLGLPLREYIHTPTFILANVILDIEPFLVLILGLEYPLHGYFHAFLLAFIVGLALGSTMLLLEGYLHPLYRMLLLETDSKTSLKRFVLAGFLGTMFHVLLDSPLYTDIRPFYPLTANPLYNPALSMEVYSLCVWMGIIGAAIYVGLIMRRLGIGTRDAW
ncbi:MAG: hydrolase [Candidatus Thorarchaeota archaeon]